ncbi:MAG: hypothetical protein IT372_05630, partial [Polyangiaceae bacterium]|nr:hypothetical protein [Polyangiaceae bacterium]
LPPPPPMVGPLATADMAARAAPEPARPPSVAPPARVEPAPPPAPSSPEVPIAQCAAIAASLAMRPQDAPRVLHEEELTPERWEAAERRWAAEIQKELTRGKAALLRAYDDAYVARLEEERGPLQVEEYAALVVAAERGVGEAALAELRLPRGAAMRIERVWLDRIAADPALAKAVRAAVDAARDA